MGEPDEAGRRKGEGASAGRRMTKRVRALASVPAGGWRSGGERMPTATLGGRRYPSWRWRPSNTSRRWRRKRREKGMDKDVHSLEVKEKIYDLNC
jgi:hypothetical protein